MLEKKQHKRGYAAAVGGLFMVLAVIGIVTLVVLSVQLTGRLLDNQRQKEELEKLLQPVVMFDPVPFATPGDIDNQRLLLYSMWSVLSDENVNKYKRSEENQALLVPASDLEVAAHSLFGKDITLKHNTFTDYEISYFYDEPNNTYQVQTYNFLYVYRPEVLEISKVDGKYHLLIHYIPPDNAWERVYAGGDKETLSTKKMLYILDKIDDGWNLLSVKDAPRDSVIDEYLDPNAIEKPVREVPEITTENPFPSDNSEEPVAGAIIPPAPEEEKEKEETASDSDSLSLLDTDKENVKEDVADGDGEDPTGTEEEIPVVPADTDTTDVAPQDEPVASAKDS